MAIIAMMTTLSKTPWVYWSGLFLGIGLLLGAAGYDWIYPRPSVHEYNDFHTSAFRGNDADPMAPPREDDVQEFEANEFSFYAAVPGDVTKIELTMRYDCVDECGQIWLELVSQPTVIPPRILVRHPIFETTNLLSVAQGHLQLYQPVLAYGSVDEFLENSPEHFISERVIGLAKQFSSPGISYLETLETYDGDQYILSTFRYPRTHGEWSTLRRRFDISHAVRDERGLIEFRVYRQTAEPSVLRLTEPEVVYF